MENFKKVSAVLFFLVGIQITLFGQSDEKMIKDKGTQIVAIETSAHCQDCKDRIEYELTFTKGIISTYFDTQSKKLVVKYKAKKINRDEIRDLIASLGYDADYIKANKEAYNMLPKSCKSPALKASGN